MSTTTIDERVEQIHKTNEELFNRGNLDYVDEAYTEDVVVHDVPRGEDYEGREAFRGWLAVIREAYPDFETEIQNVILGDEMFVTQYVGHGTNDGPVPGIDHTATHETVEFRGVTVHRMDGEKASEAWWYYDRLGELQQLGIVPEKPPA